MPLNLASPGIVVREIDLTIGRTTPSSDKIGAIVAPFAKGPVDVPTLVENENDLLNSFGNSYSIDHFHFQLKMEHQLDPLQKVPQSRQLYLMKVLLSQGLNQTLLLQFQEMLN